MAKKIPTNFKKALDEQSSYAEGIDKLIDIASENIQKVKKLPSINTIRKKLKKVLENQGNYSEGIDTIIEITAGNLYAYYLALRDVEALGESFVEEITREGNIKLAPHPAIKTLRDQSEMIRRQLRELRLTLSTAEGSANDELEDLIEEVNNVE